MQNDINILLQYICEIKKYYFTRNMFSVCLMYDFFILKLKLVFTKQNIYLSVYRSNIYIVQLKKCDLKKVYALKSKAKCYIDARGPCILFPGSLSLFRRSTAMLRSILYYSMRDNFQNTPYY